MTKLNKKQKTLVQRLLFGIVATIRQTTKKNEYIFEWGGDAKGTADRLEGVVVLYDLLEDIIESEGIVAPLSVFIEKSKKV